MQQSVEKSRERITGVPGGLDRLVFRGSPRRLSCERRDEKPGAVVAQGWGTIRQISAFSAYRGVAESMWFIAIPKNGSPSGERNHQ
jgi:hypothetical protein